MKSVHFPALLLVLALTGCGSMNFGGSDKAAPGTMLRECQDAAENDHSLNEFAAEHATVSGGTRNPYSELLAQLRNASVDRCLQQHGAVPRGGVENVKG